MGKNKIRFLLIGLRQCESLSDSKDEFQNLLDSINELIEDFLNEKMEDTKNNGMGSRK